MTNAIDSKKYQLWVGGSSENDWLPYSQEWYPEDVFLRLAVQESYNGKQLSYYIEGDDRFYRLEKNDIGSDGVSVRELENLSDGMSVLNELNNDFEFHLDYDGLSDTISLKSGDGVVIFDKLNYGEIDTYLSKMYDLSNKIGNSWSFSKFCIDKLGVSIYESTFLLVVIYGDHVEYGNVDHMMQYVQAPLEIESKYQTKEEFEREEFGITADNGENIKE